METVKSAESALTNVLEALSGKRIILVCDKEKESVGKTFAEGAIDLGLWTQVIILDSKEIRKDLPLHLLEIFTSQKPDIFMNFLRSSG